MKPRFTIVMVALVLAVGPRTGLAQNEVGRNISAPESAGLVHKARRMADEARFQGRNSCAAATCHGGTIGRGPAWNHALSQWIAEDPHAGAGSLLRDDDSRRIVIALEARAAESAQHYDRVLRERCISCHVTIRESEVRPDAPLSRSEPAPRARQQGRETDVRADVPLTAEVLARGVSCESCHGAAENWIDEHVDQDWRGASRFEDGTRMRDTESMVGRAATCLRCHVGSRRSDGLVRDVNHDLIAAGHPPLRFDLALYHENLPKHWDPDSDAEQKMTDSYLRLRSVGRAAGLAAAARLSSQRATDHREEGRVPWPELADYDCFDCHQALSIRQYRLPADRKRRSPLRISDGLPMWNAWHTVDELQLGTDQLRRLSPHQGDPAEMEVAAQALANRYQAKAERLAEELPNAKDALGHLLESTRKEPPLDWHQAAIRYLDIEAAARDLAAENPQARVWLSRLRDQVEPLLRFDRHPDGGVDDDRDRELNSPAHFDSGKFQRTLLSIFETDPVSQEPSPNSGEQP